MNNLTKISTADLVDDTKLADAYKKFSNELKKRAENWLQSEADARKLGDDLAASFYRAAIRARIRREVAASYKIAA